MAVNKYTEARKRANEKYNAKSYDRINIAIPKGEKGKIKSHAEQRGESVNGFIKRAINETMERDGDYTELSGTAEIQPKRMDKFTSDVVDSEIVKPTPKE